MVFGYTHPNSTNLFLRGLIFYTCKEKKKENEQLILPGVMFVVSCVKRWSGNLSEEVSSSVADDSGK